MARKYKQLVRPLLLPLIIVALLVLSQVFGFGQQLTLLEDQIESTGIRGALLFIAIYTLASLALVPNTPMMVAGGAIYGSLAGIAVVSIAATLGAAAGFLISKYLARDSVEQWLGRNRAFQRIDRLAEKHCVVIIAITRLVPVFPYPLLNYAFGLAKIRFSRYVLWSLIFMFPQIVLYVVGTDVITGIIAGEKVPWALVAVFAVFIVLLIVLINKARSYLKKK